MSLTGFMTVKGKLDTHIWNKRYTAYEQLDQHRLDYSFLLKNARMNVDILIENQFVKFNPISFYNKYAYGGIQRNEYQLHYDRVERLA
jgi:hypothetical protein